MLLTVLVALLLLCLVAFFLALVRSDRPLIKHTVSHWQQTVAGLHGSTTEFYELVKAAVEAHEFPYVEVNTVELHEGGPFSPTREYLRIERGEYTFDLCVASFGKGLFVSSWLCEKPSFLLQVFGYIPGINWLAAAWVKLFKSPTYYRVDSASMFLDGVHGCILAILDELTRAQGVDPIPAEERKPKMRELYSQGRKALA